MAGMIAHVAISGCVAVLVDQLPIGLPEKIGIVIGVSFISHFVLDAIPHGEMKGGMLKEFAIGVSVYFGLALLSYFVRGIEVALLFCISGFFGILPDGFLFLAHYFPHSGWARTVFRQNLWNHWFQSIWQRKWIFGWQYYLLTAIGYVLIYLTVLIVKGGN